ncbi:uncharacterized protein ACB057_012252 [Neosynchiropus ocellatus]
MSEATTQDQPAQAGSSGSGQTLPSRLLQPVSDPSASKRVCFYKSGDLKFSGHRMVITGRTFKTFDGLLDALSNKVPLPFGVRTITTPRGTHVVKGLEDLHDGGSYVCSDQRRVKPLDLAEVNRRQVPWNTTRPFSTGRQRRQGLLYRRRNEVNRPEKTTERVAVRTPKRLVVIKNRDPTVKRTIVLQKRTAPTFDALLDYLSQILQFPVLKLYSTDGRRVGGLAALILCSGVIVAAGSEPFRLANSVFRTAPTGQPVDAAEPLVPQQTLAQTNKSSSGRGSRNFSLSSEKHIVNQIHKSLRRDASEDTTLEQRSMRRREDSPTDGRHYTCIVPRDDDIEKSFRVNQDGSMTVEMKVHLTIKEEETLHWTTTLSRSTISKRTSCAPVGGSRRSSPDSNHASERSSSPTGEDDPKEVNHSSFNGKAVCFNSEEFYEAKSFQRRATPGPVKKRASVESVRTESGHQERTVSQYSFMEKSDDGEMTEGYCVVRHTSSSSSYPIPKPRNSSAGTMRSGVGTSGIAEVLQIQNRGMDVRETVMHIYESHGGFDNYLANEEYSAGASHSQGSPLGPGSRASGGSEVPSSSNDIDFSATDSLPRQRDEMLSLSSEPLYPTLQPSHLPPVAETEAPKKSQEVAVKDLKKKDGKASRSQKSSTSTSGSDEKDKNSKHSSPDKVSSNTSMERKSLASEAAKRDPKSKREKHKASPGSAVSGAASKKQSRTAAKENGHNVNTPTERPLMKKNLSDILTPKRSSAKKRKAKTPPTDPSEPRENVSIKSLNASQQEIQQYVESWLEEVSPDQVPYTDEARESTGSTKVLFKLGADSESDEKNGTTAEQEEGLTSDTSRESASSLTAPPSSEALQPNVCPLRGLSTSAPNVRVDAVNQEGMQRSHRSAEALAPLQWEPSTASLLSPKIKALPLLQQIYTSDQDDKSDSTEADKVSSISNFSSQVASVFGASCKALLSFLSVMTLRDTLAISSPSKTNMAPEAMLMLESLQKISVIEDQGEQRASLTELQSRTSSQLRNRWTAFQIMRDRLHSEPPSPRVSETEFALDVVSEEGDFLEEQKGIEELMEELNMPQDLREEISLTIHHSKCLYPALEGAGESREAAEEDANWREEGSERASADLVKDPEVKESEVSETQDEKLGEEPTADGGITRVAGRMESEDERTEEESVMKEEEGTASEVRDELKEDAGEKLADMDDSVVDTDERDAEDTDGGEEQSETEDRNIIDTIDEEEGMEEEASGGSPEVRGDVSDEDQKHQEEEKTVVLSDEQSEEDAQKVASDCDSDEKNEPDEEEKEGRDGPQTEGENDPGGGEDGEGGERTEAAPEQVLEEASYLTQQEEKSSPDELQSGHEDDKEQTEGVTEAESEERKQTPGFQPHPVEISQELLDFINSALQSASLVFTYDSQGRIRIAQDNDRATPTRVKRRQKSRYSSKRLPSPNTSDLSDYRPESNESGERKTEASLEIASEDSARTSVSEASVRHAGDSAVEGNSQVGSNKSSPAHPEASAEDGSPLRAHPEAAPEVASGHDAAEGVLIDRGRWLLRENHLMRKSPPLAQGMYAQLDSSSLDTLDSPTQPKTMRHPLGAISSSELEDLAKPPSPKCTYYNMPHGSDSDPFSDDYGATREAIQGRGSRVSPAVDTSKTWANKNGSLSSFASVEFKMHDRKIHPQEETIVVTQARGTSRVREGVLQEQDSMENLRLRCNPYCPIL